MVSRVEAMLPSLPKVLRLVARLFGEVQNVRIKVDPVRARSPRHDFLYAMAWKTPFSGTIKNELDILNSGS